MSKKQGAYIVILLSVMLIIWNLTQFNFYNLKENHYSGIVSSLLIILAMILSIRNLNKTENNK